MSSPDFMPDGAPVPRPLPFADPTDTQPTPRGLPPGMSPLPKNQLPPGPQPGKSPIDLTKPQRAPRRDIDLSKGGAKKPIDLSKPKKVNEPRKPTRAKIKLRWSDIIEHILEDNPSSDGTLPDFDEKPSPDEPYPDDSNEAELNENECADTTLYPSLKGRPGASLTQIRYDRKSGYPQDSFFLLPDRSVQTVYRKTYVTEDIPEEFRSPSRPVFEYKIFGRKTVRDANGRAFRSYKFGVRSSYRRSGDGKLVQNGWSLFQSLGFPTDTFPSFTPQQLMARFGTGEVQRYYLGTEHRDTFNGRVSPCPEDEAEPQDPDEYDREDDEENMACKWKPDNDPNVESLELQNYEYVVFYECGVNRGQPEARYNSKFLDMPKCIGPTMVKMLNELAYIQGAKCTESSSKFWNIKAGEQSTLYAGIPAIQGLEVSLPIGCVNVGITFDNVEAKQDTSLRNLKRIGNSNASGETFVNTMRVWLIDSMGNAIDSEELWVPSTLLSIPFRYRDEACKIRMMPKGMYTTFTIFDTGDRWEAKSIS